MPADTQCHIKRIGAFYCIAIALSTHKLSFLSLKMIGPFIGIAFGNIKIAILWFLLSCWFNDSFTNRHKKQKHPDNTDTKHRVNISTIQAYTHQFTIYNFFNAFTILMLIILSGDIEINPGPNYTNSNSLSIIHLNANRMKNKLQQIQLRIKDIDIVTISETWLGPEIADNDLILSGFHKPIRKDRDGTGGGVAIYVRESLFLKQRPDLDVNNLEAIWVETKIKNETLLIGSFYRPGSKPVSYWKLIDESIQNAASTGNRFIVLGDLNSDYLENPSKHLLDLMTFNNLNQVVTSPTRYTDTTASCLSLILTPFTDIIRDVGVMTPICSDHSVPIIKLNTNTPRDTSFKRTVYNYSKLDIDKINDWLSMSDLTNIALTEDIDMAAEKLSDTIMSCASKCMPVKTIKTNLRDPPWVNTQIKDLLEQKNRTYNRAKHTNSAIDWAEYRTTRNAYTSAIRKRKKDYDTDLDFKISNTTKFNDKNWWKTVSSFLKKNGSETKTIPPLESETGEIIYTCREKAELFNSFFAKQSTVDSEDDAVPHIPYVNNEISPLVISSDYVFQILSTLDTSKAVGPDLVHNTILTNCAKVLAPPLAILFNRSINEGKFPKIWKTAHVAPIHKKDEKHKVDNYRPISLLSCIGKVMETCVQKHILDYLLQNNLIASNQSGFLPTHSTIYQLLNIYDDICSNLDRNITTQAIFFDISKAFDKVWHRGLIKKLDAIGIRGKFLPWFEDYISNH